jgi:CRISPR/Cas system-associated exonuclease Cas4 (RecB family)
MSNWEFLSASRLNSDCPASLNYRYNEGIKSPDNFYQILGDGGEAGIEAILRNHSSSTHHPHLAESEVWATIKRRCEETGVEVPADEDVARVIAAVEQFQPASDYVLRSSQEKILLETPRLPMPVIGYLDFRGEEGGEVVIDDVKVSSARLSKPKPEWILQLGVYALAVKISHGLSSLPRTRIIFLNRSSKPSCSVLEVEHTVESLSNIFLRASQIQRYLELDWWPPNRSSQFCNERNCAFWYRCHSDHLIPYSEIVS